MSLILKKEKKNPYEEQKREYHYRLLRVYKKLIRNTMNNSTPINLKWIGSWGGGLGKTSHQNSLKEKGIT